MTAMQAAVVRGFSRRALLSGAAVLAGTALLAACGAPDDTSKAAAVGSENGMTNAAKAAPVGSSDAAATAPVETPAGSGAVVETTGSGFVGYVYVLTNTSQNAVAIWGRAANGQLVSLGSVATGGAGIGDQQDGEALGSQNALVMSADGRYLYAVNGGSGDISAFSVAGDKLSLLTRVSSNGPRPISLTTYGNLLYVLNNNRQAGTAGNITGFTLANGRPTALANSTRALSSNSAVDPGQIQFSPDGKVIAVPEKKTNRIVLYVMGANGLVTKSQAWDIASRTPFALAFGAGGVIVTADANGDRANAGTASSHLAYTDGTLEYASAPLANGQTASCWVAVSPNRQFAFTANFLSKTLTGYRIADGGAISLLQSNGLSARTNSGTRDVGFTPDGRYLYALNTLSGTISGFAVGGDGGLSSVGEFGKLDYTGADGMVVR